MTIEDGQKLRFQPHTTFSEGSYFDPVFSTQTENEVSAGILETATSLEGFTLLRNSEGVNTFRKLVEREDSPSDRSVAIFLKSRGGIPIAHEAIVIMEGSAYYFIASRDGGKLNRFDDPLGDEGMSPNRADILKFKNAVEELAPKNE